MGVRLGEMEADTTTQTGRDAGAGIRVNKFIHNSIISNSMSVVHAANNPLRDPKIERVARSGNSLCVSRPCASSADRRRVLLSRPVGTVEGRAVGRLGVGAVSTDRCVVPARGTLVLSKIKIGASAAHAGSTRLSARKPPSRC